MGVSRITTTISIARSGPPVRLGNCRRPHPARQASQINPQYLHCQQPVKSTLLPRFIASAAVRHFHRFRVHLKRKAQSR